MWTTREIDGVARALREVADALAEASSEAKSRDARRANDDDDEDDGPALGAVKGATLAGNCAVKLREALERVEAHAGEAFRDVEGATKAAARRKAKGGEEGEGDDDDGEDDAFEDMFDKDGKPRRGSAPRRGHTLPGMSDALGELRGVLQKVGVKSAAADGGGGGRSDELGRGGGWRGERGGERATRGARTRGRGAAAGEGGKTAVDG